MVQKRLIDLGCRWNSKIKSDRARGFMAMPRNLHHKYIYVSLNGTINTDYHKFRLTKSSRETTLLDLYVGHFIKEIFNETENNNTGQGTL